MTTTAASGARTERAEKRELAAAFRQAARPPVGEVTFWSIQAMVILLAALHLVVDLQPDSSGGAFPGGIPVALLIIPVGYAAVRYGLAGSAATAAWASLLWLPDLLLPNDRGHVGADLVDLALVDAVAVFVGLHIQSERLAHRRFQQATSERLAAAARYRQLLVRSEEEQRRRLARELHDEPLQLFLLLARRLERFAGADGVPAGVAAGLAEARSSALDAAVRLRHLARELRPPALDQLGLVSALSSLLAEVEEEHGLSTELEVDGTPARLGADVELGAFRIVEEAVRNAVLHAAASRLRVVARFAGSGIELSVSDDGRGFEQGGGEGAPPRQGRSSAAARNGSSSPGLARNDSSSAGLTSAGLTSAGLTSAGSASAGLASAGAPADGRGDHFGLLGMSERATLLGGRIELRSSPGSGTSVLAFLPAAPDPPHAAKPS